MTALAALMAVLPLIQKGLPEGIALARKLYEMLTSGKDPTPADWDDLEKRAKKTARQKVLEILAEAGIPLDSPIAIEMLSKVP